MTTPLHIGIAANDRMHAIANGNVQVPGYELRFDQDVPSGIFWRALKGGEFDVTEMSLAAHSILTARGENPFVGVPVFTSRMFRHASLFVSDASGIRTPDQLAGRRVGAPEYQMTAGVWMRGILHDHYGVPANRVHWLTGGVNRPGREERIEMRLPPGYQVEPIGPERTLDAMLAAGAIDAIMSPEIPAGFRRGDGTVRRLFEDSRAEERAYFEKTGIFPIMHLLVVRREVYERDPGLAVALFEAFQKAKAQAFEHLYDGDALYVMLPWLVDEIERTMALMGEDFWPYGIEPNRDVLETFVRHLLDQGMIDRQIDIAELFAGEFAPSPAG